MKNYILFLLFIPFFASAQSHGLPIDSLTNEITISEVVTVSNMSSKQLYNKAKEWAALTFKSSNQVIQLDAPDESKIIGKAYSTYRGQFMGLNPQYKLWYVFTFQARDGRYRIIITDYYLEMEKIRPSDPDVIKGSASKMLTHLAKSTNSETLTLLKTHTDNITATSTSLMSSLKALVLKKDDF